MARLRPGATMVSDAGLRRAVPVTRLPPRVAWLRQACFLAAFIAAVGAVILATVAMLWSDPAPLVAGLAIALLAVWLVVVGRGAVEGHELHSVTLVSAGIYAVMLVGVVVVPAATPILVLTTLVPLSFAAPYLSPQQLARASVTEAVVWLSCVGTAAAILLLTGQGIDNRFALYAIGSAGVMLLVFFLLDQSIRTATGLREIALRDGLTGLANRTLFVDRLEHAMTRAKRHAQPAAPAESIAVIYLDVDGFKDINDRHGHAYGDLVLRSVAQRLKSTARAADTVARIGGDEFAILIEEVTDHLDAVALAERLIEVMAEPLPLPEGAQTVRLSAGLAFSDDGAETAETLLRNADDAMYHAKRRAPGDLLVYDPELRARSEQRRRVKRALQGVIERDELRLQYQPLVSLQERDDDPSGHAPPAGTIVALEALLRWDDPATGPRMPAEFIGIAEETGDIVRIGRWVLEAACRQLREWQALPGKQGLTMMVNLSALELDQPRFGEDIRETVMASGITPDSLVFEITEHAVVPDSTRVREVLDQLQGCGVHLVIDDFGTGYSSLSYLRSLPIDGLKIAQPFVQSAVGDQQATALLRAIIEVGAALGAVVVAEGIETEDELALVRSLGCHLGQGFLLSAPTDAPEAERLLRASSRPWDPIIGMTPATARRKTARERRSWRRVRARRRRSLGLPESAGGAPRRAPGPRMGPPVQPVPRRPPASRRRARRGRRRARAVPRRPCRPAAPECASRPRRRDPPRGSRRAGSR